MSPAQGAPASAEKSLWRAWPYILVWMCLSVMIIFMNSDILHKMQFPAALTAWHMAVCTVFVRILRCVAPPSLGLFPQETPEVSMNTWITKLLPIAALFSASLAMGNRAYIYCSVAFIQMVKASHAVMTYSLNTLVGAELFLWTKFRLVTMVCLGVMLAVTGELNFDMKGFLCQCASSVSECMRVVLIGLLLNKQGLKMDPLTALSYYAPLCLVFLVPFALLTELPSDWAQFAADFQEQVGFGWLALNGFVAFCLNLSVVLLIQATNPVVYILCGVMKDVAIIMASIAMLHQPIAAQQLLGYVLAVVGIQVFNLVSRTPEAYESSGLVLGTWQVVSEWLGMDPHFQEVSSTGEDMLKDSRQDDMESCSTEVGSADSSLPAHNSRSPPVSPL
jgi:hypothetical protein